MCGSVGHYPATGLCLSGKGDLSGDGIFHQFRAHLAARPVHHIGRARGQASFAHGPHKLRSGQRSEAGRLGHEGAAGSKSGRDLPGQKVHGKVPGGDESGDAHWLAQHDAAAVRGGDPLAEVSLAFFCVIVKDIRRGEDLHFSVLEGLAHLQSQQPGDLLGSLPY